MNREVIDGLIKARRTLERNGLLEDAEPFDAAIKALEREPKVVKKGNLSR